MIGNRHTVQTLNLKIEGFKFKSGDTRDIRDIRDIRAIFRFRTQKFRPYGALKLSFLITTVVGDYINILYYIHYIDIIAYHRRKEYELGVG